MKKYIYAFFGILAFLSPFFILLCFVTEMRAQDSIGEVPLNVSGSSFKELIVGNWAAILTFVLYAVWEFALGETSKIKANSTVKLIYNWIMSFLKKKAGKVTIIAVVFGCSVLGSNVNAQSPFDGFFNPIAQNENFKVKKLQLDSTTTLTTPVASTSFLFRPSVAVTGVLFDLKTKETQTLTGAGFGISYGSYTVTNGVSYCNYSFNASLLTAIKINDETTANFGVAASVDVFNKVVGLLVGYLGTSGFADGHIVAGTTFSYSF
jgi:chromate transport protein ChrA